MTELSTEEKPKSKTETFSDLFEKSFEKINNLEGSVVEGKVISVEKEAIIVDIGLKSEGRILKRELLPLIIHKLYKPGGLRYKVAKKDFERKQNLKNWFKIIVLYCFKWNY